MKVYNSNCPLCELTHLTKWYHITPDFIIMDCKTCHIPMYVWRNHEFPNDKEVLIMLEDAKTRFPNRKVDMKRRRIHDHWHMHLR